LNEYFGNNCHIEQLNQYGNRQSGQFQPIGKPDIRTGPASRAGERLVG